MVFGQWGHLLSEYTLSIFSIYHYYIDMCMSIAFIINNNNNVYEIIVINVLLILKFSFNNYLMLIISFLCVTIIYELCIKVC